MSNKCLNWAWAARIPSGPKLALVALADHGSDHDGEDWSCFPSPDRLMDFTGFPLRTLERHLEWLDLMGWITRIAERDRLGRLIKRTYRLHRNPVAKPGSEKLSKTKACEGDPPANMAGGEEAQPAAKNAGVQPPKSADPAANMADGLYIAEPPTNPQEPPKRAGARELARWVWDRWPVEGRRGRSSPRQVEAALAIELAKPEFDEALFRAGVRFYVANRRTWGTSGEPMSAHNWVAAGRWEGFEDVATVSASGWAGPAEIWAAARAARGEGWAHNCLDRATWLAGEVRPATGWARDQLLGAFRGTEVTIGAVLRAEAKAVG